MIYPVTMYAGKCDNCGKEIKLCGGDYSAYSAKEQVSEEMGNSDWHIVHGKHYCPDCWSYDDNDLIVFKTTKPPPMAQSNEPTIEAMNVAIAAFEGRKFYGHTIDKFGDDTHNALPSLKYHTSWNWLMPVWERLRTIVSDESDEDFPAEFCTMCDAWALYCEHVNINGAHKLLYDAIQWFNQQKQIIRK